MAVLALSEIPALNNELKEFGYIIHVHDACGGQAFELKALGESPNHKVFEFIEKYFSEKSMSVKYYTEDKLNFTAR